MLAHVFGQHAHANAGEVIDGEASVTRVLSREKTLEAGPQDLISEPGLQAWQAHMFSQVLEQNLDEDTTARGSLFLVEVDHRQDVPSNGVVADEMSEEPCNVAQTVGFVAVDGVVVFGERGLEEV